MVAPTSEYKFTITRDQLASSELARHAKAKFVVVVTIGVKIHRIIILTDQPKEVEKNQYEAVFKVIKKVEDKTAQTHRRPRQMTITFAELKAMPFSANFSRIQRVNDVYKATLKPIPQNSVEDDGDEEDDDISEEGDSITEVNIDLLEKQLSVDSNNDDDEFFDADDGLPRESEI